MGLALPHGGHLTHGSPVNFSGTLFQATSCVAVREDTGRIDYDEVRELARRERPRLLIGGGSAYPRVIDFASLRAIAEGGRAAGRDVAHIAGLIAGGATSLPVPPRPDRHDHHAQDAARPAGGGGSSSRIRRGREQSRQPQRLPRAQGGPRRHHRRQGRGLRRGPAPRVQGLRPADREERQGAGRGADETRLPTDQWRDGQSPRCSWTCGAATPS